MTIQSFAGGPRISQLTTSAFTSANMNGPSYLTFEISPCLMAMTGAGPQQYMPVLIIWKKVSYSSIYQIRYSCRGGNEVAHVKCYLRDVKLGHIGKSCIFDSFFYTIYDSN